MIYETSITNPKKQLEFYKDLSEQLQQENKELKQQLEEYIRAEMRLKAELEKQRKEYQEDYKDIRIEIKEYKSQQKEFKEYLENEISEFKKISVRDLEAALVKESHIKLMEEIMSKYNEIIGG